MIYAFVSVEKYWPFLESPHIILKQQELKGRTRVAITLHMSESKSDTWFLIVLAWERMILRSLHAPNSAPSAIVCGKAAMSAEMWKGIN